VCWSFGEQQVYVVYNHIGLPNGEGWPMAFVELTRILPKNKTVKWSVNQNNIIYFQESIDTEVGCTLVDVAGTDIDVVESYKDVKAKLKDS
jgi:hypothetical protein